MFCIRFNNNRRTKLKEKFSLIYDIIQILSVKNKIEIYWSDYTFSKVPESKTFNFIQDTIMDNESIIDNKNADKFITILITLKDNKKIQIEITPPKARRNQNYMPHIEFSFYDEQLNLFEYFKNPKRLSHLVRVLNKYNSSIDEAYFYDPLSGLNCYSDVSNRLWQKRNCPKTFTKDLLSKIDNIPIDKKSDLETETIFNLAFNFVSLLYEPEGINKINNLVSQSKLQAEISSGSIILSGQDIPELIKLLKQKLDKYIRSIKEKNIYKTEFNKVFKLDSNIS